MLQQVHKYRTTWLMLGANALQETFVNRGSAILFLTGKLIRLTLMTTFLLVIQQQVSNVGGYSSAQIVVFYLTYQCIDIVGQVLYRGVYNFGAIVRDGTFDGILTKPINPLFRVLTGEPDINDLMFLIPFAGVAAYLLHSLQITFTPLAILLYIGLLLNSFIILTAFHILIASITMLTLDVDNIIFLYRDLSRLGQFPVTLYGQILRVLLFVVVPVGLMITVPAQVLLNTPPSLSIGITTLIGVTFFFLSLRIWNWALRKYSSASS